MVQYARPDADDTDGNWTDKSGGAVLYTSIDEASADDATTYIKVADNGSDEACIVRLGDVSAPGSSGTYIKYKAMTQDNSCYRAPRLRQQLPTQVSVQVPLLLTHTQSLMSVGSVTGLT